MKNKLSRLLLVSLLLSIVACNKKEAPPEGAAPSTQPAAPLAPSGFTPARQTSFGEVTSQLDAGGNLFVYLSTDQWLAGLSTNVSQLRDVLMSLPDGEPSKREFIERGFD